MLVLLKGKVMKSVVRIVVLLFALPFFVGCTVQYEPYLGLDFIMNTFVEQKWHGKNAETAYADITSALEEYEATMTLFSDDSEIALLNANAGVAPVELSEAAFLLLELGKSYGEQSGGIFDITVAPLVTLWGITGDNPTVPDPDQLAETVELVDYRLLELNEENSTAYLPTEGMAVDLGGFAKGAALSLVEEIATEHKVDGFVSIGGNLYIHGGPYNFGVRDPLGDQSSMVGIVALSDITMATSGGYERFFEEGGESYHHILDPRSGYPADSDLLSVSVFSANGALADFMSTYIFVEGSESLLDHLYAEDYYIVAIDIDKNLYVSPGFAEYFTPTAADYTLMDLGE